MRRWLLVLISLLLISFKPVNTVSKIETFRIKKIFTYNTVNNEKLNIDQISPLIFSKIQELTKYKNLNESPFGTNVKNVVFDIKGSDVYIKYINFDYYKSIESSVVFKLSILLNAQDNNYILSISEADSAIVSCQKKCPYLDSITNLKNDVRNILTQLDLKLEMNSIDSGDFNVPFKDDAVFGNFDRILKKDVISGNSKDDIQKLVLYKMPYNNKNIQISISIYPYRDGSKVVYKINYPYMLNSNGTNDYNLDDIKIVIEKIKRIAND